MLEDEYSTLYMYIIIIADLASLLITRNTARVLMPPEKFGGLYISKINLYQIIFF